MTQYLYSQQAGSNAVLTQFDGLSSTVLGSFSMNAQYCGDMALKVVDDEVTGIIVGETRTGYVAVYNPDMSGAVLSRFNTGITNTDGWSDIITGTAYSNDLDLLVLTTKNTINLYSGLTNTLVGQFNLPNGLNDYQATCVAIDDSVSGTNDLVISRYKNIYHPEVTLSTYVFDGVTGTVKDVFIFDDLFPSAYVNRTCVDDGGNLLCKPHTGGFPSMIYKMNGLSREIIDAVDIHRFASYIEWFGAADKYDAITGYPDVDAMVPVVDGCWQDPNTGNYNKGLYVKAIINASKILGYTGATRAEIIQAAAQSDVNADCEES